MTRIPDGRSLGRSRLAPFIRGEAAPARHRRRLHIALGNQRHVEDWCREQGIELKVCNGGLHWRFVWGDRSLDWWPSTAKLVFDGQYAKGVHAHDTNQVLRLIGQARDR